MKTKCVIFDFDGTIADTRALACKVLNLLAAKHSFRQLEAKDLEPTRLMSKAELMTYLNIPKWKVPMLLLEGRAMMADGLRDVSLFEGIHDVLRFTRSKFRNVGIITSNTKSNVDCVLQSQHVCDCFDFISTVAKLSQKHKSMKAVMRTFSLSADELLYIGDEMRDIRAAHKAGVPSVAVTWGYNAELALRKYKPMQLVANVAELRKILTGIATTL